MAKKLYSLSGRGWDVISAIVSAFDTNQIADIVYLRDRTVTEHQLSPISKLKVINICLI